MTVADVEISVAAPSVAEITVDAPSTVEIQVGDGVAPEITVISAVNEITVMAPSSNEITVTPTTAELTVVAPNVIEFAVNVGGPPGPHGLPTTLYIQPEPPDLSAHPAGYPLWLDTDEVAEMGEGGGGSTILSGYGPPADSLGESGNFYVDFDGNTLYGPKTSTPLSPPPQTLFTNQTPVDEFLATAGEVMGESIMFHRAGLVTGLRYYRGSGSDPALTSTTLRIFRNEVELGVATTVDETGSGWKTATLDPPVPLEMGDVLRIMVDLQDGHMVAVLVYEEYGEGYYYQMAPVANRHMSSAMGYYGFLDEGVPVIQAFPFPMMVDAWFVADPTLWPVAVSSTYAVVMASPDEGMQGNGEFNNLEVLGDFHQEHDREDYYNPGATLELEVWSTNDGYGVEWSTVGQWESAARDRWEWFGIEAYASEYGGQMEINASRWLNIITGETLSLQAQGYYHDETYTDPGIVEVSGTEDGNVYLQLDGQASQMILDPTGAGIMGPQLWLGSSDGPVMVGDAGGYPQRVTNVADPVDPLDVVNLQHLGLTMAVLRDEVIALRAEVAMLRAQL